MSTGVVVAVVVAALVLGLIASQVMRRRMHAQAIRRERLEAELAGHRQQAETNFAQAPRLAQRAERKRNATAVHAANAQRERSLAVEAGREADDLERRADVHRRA